MPGRVRSSKLEPMNERSHACSGSLSRGVAWTRLLVAVVVLAAAALGLSKCFRSRESRLWDFVADARSAAIDLREDDLFKCFDPAVRYRRDGNIDGIRRDWKRWKAAGIGTAAVTHQEAHLDERGADVDLTVVLTVGIQPVGQYVVRLRAEDGDGTWRVVALDWQ